MKKISLMIICLLLVIFVTIKVEAARWYYQWENVHIKVDLYDSIYNYTNLPKAKLYKDNTLLSDAKISYNTSGDWLCYLKDVNTSIPGKYEVWYKAYENKYRPGTCSNYKQKILFEVVDDEAPIISLNSKDLTISNELDKFDYSNYFTVKDNSTKTEEIKIQITDKVNYKIVGDYEVIITAIDKSNNKAESRLNIHIRDLVKPIINYIGNNSHIILELGEVFDIRKYFKVLDGSEDITLNYRVELPFLTPDNKVKYIPDEIKEYKFSFFDKNKNITEIKMKVEVKDSIKPLLKLNHTRIEEHYLTDFSNYNWFKYIEEASDNGEDLLSEVNVDTANISNKVGEYIVYYSVKDKQGLEAECELSVNLKATEPPLIETEDVKVKVGQEVNLKDFIKVEDESDSNVINNLEIESNIDFTKAGIYYATVVCHNSSLLYSDAIIKVEVIDNNKSGGIFDLKMILIVGLVIIIIILGILYFIKKRNKKDDLEIDI